MPELPEVETIRRQLAPRIVGRTVVAAQAHPSPKFASAVDAISHRFEAVGRRGKYLIARLDRDRELIVHLGMTGVCGSPTPKPRPIRTSAPRGRSTTTPCSSCATSAASVASRSCPRVTTTRCPTLHALGPEPLSDEFDPLRSIAR